MKIDLTCPAELWRYELPKEEYAACDLMMYNLSDKLIISMEVTLILSDKDGDEQDRLTFRAHDLRGEPGKTFGMSVPVEEHIKPGFVEAIIEKVWFDDNSIWRRGKGAMSEYTSNALPNGRSLEMLRYAAGPTAVGFPQEQDGLWLCVCGRPNADYSDYCIRCHREKKMVFQQFTREAIEKMVHQREQQLALKAKAAREDASRLQLQREKEYQEKKKRRRKVTLTVSAVLAAVALTYVGVHHVAPYVQYRLAVKDMQDGQWAKAQTAFADMGTYLDAEAYARQCEYLIARNKMNAKDAKILLEAREALAALGEYEDAPDLVKEADYLRAGMLLSDNKVAEASDIYVSLGDYQDSADQVTLCAYLTAEELLSTAQYEEAHAAYVALGDYKDAASKAKQAIYLPGKASLEVGELDAALTMLNQVADYEDAAELIKQCHYLQGVQLKEEGEMLIAGEEFLLAGDYQDAALLASECIYTPANEAMQQGEYAYAAELFAKIASYEDAEDKRCACLYTIASASLNDLEYTMASSYLAQLPNDYQDVATMKKECIYNPALNAYERKDYQAAVDGFSQIPGYRDADKQLNKARYRLADAFMEDKNYVSAMMHYELLGDYSDSEKQLKIARYNQAEIEMKAGNYAGAEVLYVLVGEYKNAENQLKKARYAQAEALLAAGDYAAARPVFEMMGDYNQSETNLMACDYLKANALLAEKQLLEAAELYASISRYEDAGVKAKETYYALAQETRAEGRVLQAARYFDLAGDVQDAAAQAESLYDECYATVAADAAQAMENKEYALAARLLQATDLTDLPPKYAHLLTTCKEANYQEAERLDKAGFPYDALPYYRAVPGYKNTDSRLERVCYRILGAWVNKEGEYFIFREDGTCNLAGEELYYSITGTQMYTGASKDDMKLSHRISAVHEQEAKINDLRNNRTKIIPLSRTDMPQETVQEQQGAEVVDE